MKADGAFENPEGRVAWGELRGRELRWRIWSPTRLREYAAKASAKAWLAAEVTPVLVVWVATPLVEFEQTWVLIHYMCLVVGIAGVLLLLSAVSEWRLGDLAEKRVLRIFPEMAVRNVIPLQRHRSMPLMKDFPNFGLLLSSVLFVLVIAFNMFSPLTPNGLLVDIRERTAVAGRESPWAETLGVYVDDQRGFYVNGQPVAREKLRARLSEELGRRAVWTVYFEGNGDGVFMDAAYAIDTIERLGAKVVWITPKMREELSRMEAR